MEDNVAKASLDGTHNVIDGEFGEKLGPAIAKSKSKSKSKYGNATEYMAAGALFGTMNVITLA